MFSFIGRSDDVEVIRALLTRGERIVTVAGAAGMGKSRLAREIVRAAQLGGPNPIAAGVLACDLDEACTEDDVATVLAHATNAEAHGPRPFEAIGERLAAHGDLLLVLDGVASAALAKQAVTSLLEAAPRLQLLVASDEPLGIDGEQVHALGPLAIDDGVALVRERLVGAGADKLDESEEQTLVRIVELLDGVPLALELGALCITGLGLSAVSQHLARTALLARGTVPMVELLALAWRVLDPHERSMLARCSVFRGGFTADAALAVAGGDRRALDALESLGDKALLGDDDDRLRLHPLVRRHAATQLEPEDEARARHAAHYLDSSEAWARDPSIVEAADAGAGAPRPTSLARIAAERDNLLAVVEHALAAADGTTAARGLLVLLPVALARGPIPPYLALVERALDLPMPIDRRIALLAARGKGLRRTGRGDEAEQVQHDAVLLAQKAGFRREEARLLGALGMAAYARCDFDTALARFRAALELQIVLGDAGEQAVTMAQLAMVHRELGAIDEARDAALRALPILRTTGGATHLATTLVELARCHLDAGDLDRARADLAVALEAGGCNAVVSAYVRCFAAVVEHAAGDLDAAEAGYVAAIHASRDAGHPRLEGGAFVYLGILSFDRGDLDVATERLEHGLALLRLCRDVRYSALASAYVAACARLAGDEERAAALFTEARGAVREGDPVRTAIDILQLTPGASPLPPYAAVEHAASSWDVRHALERYERTAGSRTTETFETDAVFQVAADGAWMEHAGRHVECSRRAATQRLLAALARARTEAPGQAIPSEDLVAAGWPNEHIMSSAAKNRLRVALSWLRKNGLGHALQSRADGYLLDPELVGVAPPSSDRRGDWNRS